MRTQEEILKRIKDVEDDDFFGATRNDLTDFLTFENAKEFLKEGVKKKDWKQKKPTEEIIKHEIRDYLPFAWDKANNCRGLSANISIDHMKAYAWLLGDDVFEKLEEIEYKHYGKEKFIFMSELSGFNWKKTDDGVRTN